MKNICVFCGSAKGNNPVYEAAARSLGQILAEQKIQLIYGGGRIGLMGAIADEVLKNGGEVTGVIPEFLMEKEVGHPGVTTMHVVSSMHERKQKMASLSDAFIALPGGLGTLEELAEILTWVQLELIKKPVGLLNINSFYDGFIHQLDIMTEQGFIKMGNRKNLIDANSPLLLYEKLRNFKFDGFSIWDNLDKT